MKTLSDLHLGILIRLSEHLSRQMLKLGSCITNGEHTEGGPTTMPDPHERNSILTRRLQEHKAGSGACSLFLTKLLILEFRDHFYPPPSGRNHSAAPFSSLQKCTLVPAASGEVGSSPLGPRAGDRGFPEPATSRARRLRRAEGAPYP